MGYCMLKSNGHDRRMPYLVFILFERAKQSELIADGWTQITEVNTSKFNPFPHKERFRTPQQQTTFDNIVTNI